MRLGQVAGHGRGMWLNALPNLTTPTAAYAESSHGRAGESRQVRMSD